MSLEVLEGVVAVAWLMLLFAPLVARSRQPDEFGMIRRYRRARRALARRMAPTPRPARRPAAPERPSPRSPLIRRRRVVVLLGTALILGVVLVPMAPVSGALWVLGTLVVLVGYVALLRQAHTTASSAS